MLGGGVWGTVLCLDSFLNKLVRKSGGDPCSVITSSKQRSHGKKKESSSCTVSLLAQKKRVVGEG